MAGVRFVLQTPEFTTPTSKFVALQVKAGANSRLKVSEWSVSLRASSATVPPLVQIMQQSTDASAGTGLTPRKVVSSDSETIQATAWYNDEATSQPTDTYEEFGEEVNYGYTWQAPYGQEIIVIGGGHLGMCVTSAAALSMKARFVCEE